MNTQAKVGKVLIVDDEPTNIQILNEILRNEYETTFATDGQTALELIAEEMPDIVLLDVMMPGMDGHEVCRRLKSDDNTRGIQIIFVTAMDQQSDELAGLSLGAVDFLTKPVNPGITRARVRNHMRMKKYQDMLEELAFRDALTGVANRRQFDTTLDAEWRRCERAGEPISLALMDIDHFKAYNDNYGHGEGDECLRQVAETMAEATGRAGDLLARYGGEEFACIMPNTDTEGAAQLAERLRASIEGQALKHEHSSTADHVTISVGVATAVPDKDLTPQSLIEAADNNLYKAKDSGRNQVCAGTNGD